MKLHPELILSGSISITGFNCVHLSCISCIGQLPEKGNETQPDAHRGVFCLEGSSQTGTDDRTGEEQLGWLCGNDTDI